MDEDIDAAVVGQDFSRRVPYRLGVGEVDLDVTLEPEHDDGVIGGEAFDDRSADRPCSPGDDRDPATAD
ncbi:hypothetical protein GCM10027167_15180 [Nocardia heshunensis]